MIKTEYEKASGKITARHKASASLLSGLVETSTVGVLEGDYDPETQYIISGVATTRPTMSLTQDKTEISANATEIATISGVPSGAKIRCGDSIETADGSDVEFTTDTVAEHTLTFSLFPYLDAEVVINAI